MLSPELRNEVTPKNILMIGPTGCGKTEIARRLARITSSPFIKVEATKFTEVGFYGKDVDSIIKDLARTWVAELKSRKREEMKGKVSEQVEEVILDALLTRREDAASRESQREQYRQGLLDAVHIDLELPPPPPPNPSSSDQQQLFVQLMPTPQHKSSYGRSIGIKKTVTVSEARTLLQESLTYKLVSNSDVNKQALRTIEQDGIVFLDEIDKICSPSGERSFRSSADASAEGVQRDLLPLVEGTAVNTSIGTIHTDHILFICSGAFHAVKPSDLLPELQGRLPIRVELKQLTEEDLYKILTVPINNLIMQQSELMKTDGVLLEWSDEAIREIARVTAEVNRTVENIGARRLNTVINKICDDLSFQAADMPSGTKVSIDKQFVTEKVSSLLAKMDLTRFVL